MHSHPQSEKSETRHGFQPSSVRSATYCFSGSASISGPPAKPSLSRLVPRTETWIVLRSIDTRSVHPCHLNGNVNRCHRGSRLGAKLSPLLRVFTPATPNTTACHN